MAVSQVVPLTACGSLATLGLTQALTKMILTRLAFGMCLAPKMRWPRTCSLAPHAQEVRMREASFATVGPRAFACSLQGCGPRHALAQERCDATRVHPRIDRQRYTRRAGEPHPGRSTAFVIHLSVDVLRCGQKLCAQWAGWHRYSTQARLRLRDRSESTGRYFCRFAGRRPGLRAKCECSACYAEPLTQWQPRPHRAACPGQPSTSSRAPTRGQRWACSRFAELAGDSLGDTRRRIAGLRHRSIHGSPSAT